jgi:hypothetical protein
MSLGSLKAFDLCSRLDIDKRQTMVRERLDRSFERLLRLTLPLALLIGLWALAALPWEQSQPGLLLLAHGAHRAGGDHHGHSLPASTWNANVERLAQRLNNKHPTEVAFGMAVPDRGRGLPVWVGLSPPCGTVLLRITMAPAPACGAGRAW